METVKEIQKDNFKLIHSKTDSGKHLIELVVKDGDKSENFEYTPFSGYNDLDYDEVFNDAVAVYKKVKNAEPKEVKINE